MKEKSNLICGKAAVGGNYNSTHDNQAASAICNTIREETGVDLMFGQSCYIASDIYAGDYTEKDLSYLCKNDGGYPVIVTLTGDQVYQLVESTLSLTGNRGSVCNDSTMYVSSGFEMDITKDEENGYVLNGLTVEGKELDRKEQFSVLIYSDRDWYLPVILEEIGCEEFHADIPNCNQYIYKRLVEDGGQLAEPTDYLKLR